MKKFSVLSLIVFALFSLTSCQTIETIFKAGMWWGIILAAVIVGVILWLVGKVKK